MPKAGLTKPGNMRRNELKDVHRSQFLVSCNSLTPVLGQHKELWDRIWRSRLVKHEVVKTHTSGLPPDVPVLNIDIVNVRLRDRAILIWTGWLTNTAVAGVGHQIHPFKIIYVTHKIVQFSVFSAEKAYQTVLEAKYSWWRTWTLKVMINFWLRTALHLCKERLVIAMECLQQNLSPVTFLNTVFDIYPQQVWLLWSAEVFVTILPNINQNDYDCGAVSLPDPYQFHPVHGLFPYFFQKHLLLLTRLRRSHLRGLFASRFPTNWCLHF